MRINKEKIIKTFFELVKIDSPSGHEEKVRDYLLEKMITLGANPKTDDEGNLFAKFPGFGKPLLLCAHMDTVEPGRGVKPIIKNGVIKSARDTILGADNKVSVAAILEALSQSNPSIRRKLEVIFSVREETDGGISKFEFSKLKSKVGIVADASFPVGEIVLASPHLMELKIEVVGQAAHAGRPESGVNALTFTAERISELKWGRIDKDTTANIGLVSGGSATNTVPERVFLEGEIRSFSKEKLDTQLKLVKKTFLKNVKEGIKVKLFDQIYCFGYRHKKTSSGVNQISKAIESVGLKINYQDTFGGSDANNFCANGIEVIDIGDGTTHSHTVDESVSVKSLVDLTKVIVNYITT